VPILRQHRRQAFVIGIGHVETGGIQQVL
jgi:hypothetical protein